jgi:hypothetical protein
MRYAIIIIVLLWFLCGFVGAWMEDSLDRENWKLVARGPLTLADAIHESDEERADLPGNPGYDDDYDK